MKELGRIIVAFQVGEFYIFIKSLHDTLGDLAVATACSFSFPEREPKEARNLLQSGIAHVI